jgi:dienelactone hydrolase
MESLTFRELTDQMMQLYRESRFTEALQLVEHNADRFPEHSARTTFWKMCLLSLCGRANDVISVFQKGLDAGLWWAESQFRDADLDAVRDLPEFKRLAAVSQEKYEEVRTRVGQDQTLLLPDTPPSGMYPLVIVLHGHNGNKDSQLEFWEAARQRGWLVLSVQSTQPTFSGAYHWDDPAQGLADLLFYFAWVSQTYPIHPKRVVMAGFSQGSGMALYAALKGNLPVSGYIGIGTWWADANDFVCEGKHLRGYFIVGEKDHTLERTREIQETLRRSNIPFAEEIHPQIGHEFPADFGASFEKAIEFIFEEQE